MTDTLEIFLRTKVMCVFDSTSAAKVDVLQSVVDVFRNVQKRHGRRSMMSQTPFWKC